MSSSLNKSVLRPFKRTTVSSSPLSHLDGSQVIFITGSFRDSSSSYCQSGLENLEWDRDLSLLRRDLYSYNILLNS